MCHAIADTANQGAQRYSHVLHSVLQQAQLILATGAEVVGQIAVGNPTRRDHSRIERTGDLTGNQDRREDTQQQYDHRHREQLGYRAVFFFIGTDHLTRHQFFRTGDDVH